MVISISYKTDQKLDQTLQTFHTGDIRKVRATESTATFEILLMEWETDKGKRINSLDFK